jgi:trimeric autotransporter adhesin
MQSMTRGVIPVFMIAAFLAARPGLAQNVTTTAGNGTAGYSGDNGPATSAQIDTVEGIAVDGLGNTYIADSRNHRIRKIAGGTITTVAGTGAEGFAGDGGSATSAQLSFPRDVTVDSQNNLYIADTGNGRIRKVTPAGVISTVAGNGTVGYSGDNGPATSAMLSYPAALAMDSAGNVYIADTWNYRIRKLTSDGKIQTVAGNGSYGPYGDGGAATSASLGVIVSIAVDAQNTLYLSDTYNHRVRKVTSGGVISSLIGGGFGAAADGGSAQTATLKFPRGISADALGSLFVADSLNHRVRQVSQAGVISTVAGSGAPGYGGDDGVATSAKLNSPVDVAAAPGGTLYFSDLWNYRVRSVQTQTSGSRCGCDVNGDGGTNISDVQLIINQALGITTAACDVSGDGLVNIVDVQKVINAVLGLGCN